MIYKEQENTEVVKKTYTEEELVSSISLGDKTAFSYLYDNYSKALFGVIVTIVGNVVESEDILQNVFLKIWNSFGVYDKQKGRLYTWMLNIARNAAIDYTRSKQSKLNFQNYSDENVNLEIEKFHYDINKVDHIGLREVFVELNEEQKKILELAYYKGFTQNEIAQQLNIPLGTVKTKLRQSIFILRKTVDLKSE